MPKDGENVEDPEKEGGREGGGPFLIEVMMSKSTQPLHVNWCFAQNSECLQQMKLIFLRSPN